jgi:hypothetical protein
MEKEFTPYEQALALKELGFDDECLGTYYKEDKTFYLNGVLYSNSYFDKAQELITEHPQITTPLYQQAFRWFREKYGLHCVYNVGIPHDNIHHSKKIKYYFNIIKLGKNHNNKFRSCFYETYEEAQLESLKKLIEIVKSK